MSEEKYQWTPEYDEVKEPLTDEEFEKEFEELGEGEELDAPETETSAEAAAELAAKIDARRRARRRKVIRRKRLTVIGIVLLFAVLFTMCGREIFRLKAENYALKKQQQELEEERDRLAKELELVGDKDYIKDQARKQLRLLDPGEIMFIFEDGTEEAADENAEQGAEGNTSG